MNPNGTFYRINESLFGFPATVAALLKYKKHEWIIIASSFIMRSSFFWRKLTKSSFLKGQPDEAFLQFIAVSAVMYCIPRIQARIQEFSLNS